MSDKPKFIPRPPEPPEVIEARWKKKKLSIENLSNNIRKLKVNVSKDIQSDDEKDSLTALVVAVMLHTAERIGNDESANNGHLGVTGFTKQNVSISGNTVSLDYTGKSGVRHEKCFTDERIAIRLKKAIKDSPSKYVFETPDGFRIKPDRVSRYLKPFGIKPKDLRGYLANKFTIEKLNKIEPEETDKKRKKQLNKILKDVAGKVGHGRPTLKKHYLIPELWDEWVNNGKIIDITDLGYLEKGGEASVAEPPAIKVDAQFKKVKCPYQIFEVIADKSNKVARIFVRVEEHYDCSEFKGKIFTLDEFKKWYSDGDDNNFTYYDDWYGFNVPDHAIKSFLDGKFNPMSIEEEWLMNNIRDSVDLSRPYYIVGYAKKESSTKKHELAHALYYLCPEYRKEADEIVSSIPSDQIFTLHNFLEDRYYDKSVFPDEMQAYLLADKKFLSDSGGWRTSYQEYANRLNNAFDRHFNCRKSSKPLSIINKGGKATAVNSNIIEYQIVPDNAKYVPTRFDLKEAIMDAKSYYESGRYKEVSVRDKEGNIYLNIKSFGDYYARFGGLIYSPSS